MSSRLISFLMVLLFCHCAWGQSSSISGTTLTREKSELLAGVTIELILLESGETVARAVSDDSGQFHFLGLPAGLYLLQASAEEFSTTVAEVFLQHGELKEVALNLEVESLQQSIEVVSTLQKEIPETGTTQTNVAAEQINIAPVRGDDFGSLLPLLPGVIRGTDGRLNMKGGRPNQSSLVVNNSSNVSDPVTGGDGYNLPVDAIETVSVLPNPYAPEFGRFSSGVTNILTRQGTNEWKFLINNFLPRPKLRDGTMMGIGGFKPRVSIRGPLIKDRLFLAQTVQYRYLSTQIPSSLLPELESDTKLESFASFTQLDLLLGSNHNISGVFSVFPQKLDYVNLDSFNPQDVTPNMHSRGHNIALSDRFTMSPTMVLESTVGYKEFDVDIFGQGLDEMFIAPEGNFGNFFNIQRRRSRTFQWVEQLNIVKENWGGEHFFKIGMDVLRNSYNGANWSRPVNVLRADGSLSQRITFSSPQAVRAESTDIAFFAQDRWRPHSRLLLELGLRVDRDGILERTNLAPRFGFVFALLPEEKGVLRGGAGIFYDQSPMNVATFLGLETRTVEFFRQDGSSAGDPLDAFHSMAEGLETPYSVTWNLEYDHRLTDQLVLKANLLHRKGFHEYLIDPIPRGNLSELRLDTRGRSHYEELELTARYQLNSDSHMIFSYVVSNSEQDLNDMDEFFGNFRNPLIRPNEYSLADTDTPHRFLVQGTTALPGKWLLSPVLELRSGFPYSTVDEEQRFVGIRNRAGRYPRVVTLDIDLQRWFKIGRWKTRIGIRVFNLFNTFNPRDFQGNIDSPNYGTFYNTLKRVIGGTLQLEP